MIALAVADRPRAREMLISGALRADYLETSGSLADSAAALLPRQPMLLHNSVWDWSLGHPAALEQREVLPRTLRALRRTRAPWFSVHLGFGVAEVGFGEGRMRARTALLEREELFETIGRNVRGLARAIPGPLFLENLDYNSRGAYEHVCQPEFITAVLEEEPEVDLLLDLAHARVSASRLGLSIADYLMRLPLERVRQIHLSGPRWSHGRCPRASPGGGLQPTSRAPVSHGAPGTDPGVRSERDHFEATARPSAGYPQAPALGSTPTSVAGTIWRPWSFPAMASDDQTALLVPVGEGDGAAGLGRLDYQVVFIGGFRPSSRHRSI